MGIFDSKNFNSQVFAKYLETVPRVKQNALTKAGIFRNRPDLKAMLADQTGGNYVSVPMVGLLGGTALNYNGSTNITAGNLDTYLQSMIVVGRAKAWSERDFASDITGHDFMEDIASQVANYWDDVDQATLLSILSGIFGVSDDSFSTNHTLDISAETVNTVGAATLNTAVQKACGANKNIFTLAIMHSVVATNLENLQVLQYFKETDANGVQRDLALASWNGRTVLVDDEVPVSDAGVYTTYILGKDAFDYCDCGVRVPSEVDRDPYTNGGADTLITRQRHLYAPRGFSFTNTNIVSPDATQLANANNWGLVANSAGTGYFNHKAIPIARILSKG